MRAPSARRRIVGGVAILWATTFSLSAVQGPPSSGLPGDSDHRQVDPCEQAVKPQGLARGLQSPCEPLGGGGAAKGDFNGDGVGDLAVGVPFEDNGTIQDAGAVNVIYGSSANGLVSTGIGCDPAPRRNGRRHTANHARNAVPH
jgi:hypothetical protein